MQEEREEFSKEAYYVTSSKGLLIFKGRLPMSLIMFTYVFKGN